MVTPMPVREGRPRAALAAGIRVEKARRRVGLIQRELAEKAGVGRVTISRIERGAQTPSVDVALAIAGTLGETVEALFGGDA
jgi:putative transcriptional regulator